MEEWGGREGRIPATDLLLFLPLTTPWYQEWCLLLLTLLNHFQCYFLCVYKTVNHAPFRVCVWGGGVMGWNTGETSKSLGRKTTLKGPTTTLQLSTSLPALHATHTHTFPHRELKGCPMWAPLSSSLSVSSVVTRANESFQDLLNDTIVVEIIKNKPTKRNSNIELLHSC